MHELSQENTPPTYLQLAAAELQRRRQAAQQGGFKAFVQRVNPRYEWYKHCNLIASVAERVALGDIKRLMLFVPPRHSKSETISRLFTAYYLYRNPMHWVGLTSYSADLAYTLSRAARENFIKAGGQLHTQAVAVKHWETKAGGGLWAAGVGGPITGKGFHLGIIDDPIKNAEEAGSEIVRGKQREWYSSTFYTRAEPNAAIVIIQTRWHEDDLSGWLLTQEQEIPEYWHVVNLPALAEPLPEFPLTCTVEADWRESGEALCPERFSSARLQAVRDQMGGYFFDALYQQRPSSISGEFFKIAALEVIPNLPVEPLRTVRAWDLAASSGRGDYTVGVKIGVDANNRFYVLDVARGRWAPDQRDDYIKQIAIDDGLSTRVRFAQDPGQAGVDQSLRLTRMLAGYNVVSTRASGSKATRALGLAAQVNAGNVSLLRGAWTTEFLEELRQFPTGRHDDQVDAAADAFNELTLTGSVFFQGKFFR